LNFSFKLSRYFFLRFMNSFPKTSKIIFSIVQAYYFRLMLPLICFLFSFKKFLQSFFLCVDCSCSSWF
jgi:hypothetical protein